MLHEYEPKNITPENVIIWHYLRGKYYNALNEHSLAIHELELALKFCPKKKKSIIRAEINLELAVALRGIEKYFLALNIAQQSYNGIKALNNKSIIGQALNTLGILHIEIKEYNKARHYLKNALTIYEELNHQHGRGKSLFFLSLLFKNQSHYQEALYLGEQAFSVFQKIGNLYNVVCSSISLGEIHFSLNQPIEASQHLKNAQILAEKIGNSHYVAQALMYLGKAHKNNKKYKESLQYFQKSLTLLELNNEPETLAITLYNTGRIFQIQENYTEALQVFNRALRLREQIGDPEPIAKVLIKISEIKFLLGLNEESLQTLRDVQTILKPTGNTKLKLRTLFQLTKLKYLMNILDSKFLLTEDKLLTNNNKDEELVTNYKTLISAIYEISLKNEIEAEKKIEKCLSFSNLSVDEYNFLFKLLFKFYINQWFTTKDNGYHSKILTLLDNWEGFCDKANLGHEILQICLIRGRLSIINSNLLDAERRFVQGSLTSEEMGLTNFKTKIETELEYIKSKINDEDNADTNDYESEYFDKISSIVIF